LKLLPFGSALHTVFVECIGREFDLFHILPARQADVRELDRRLPSRAEFDCVGGSPGAQLVYIRANGRRIRAGALGDHLTVSEDPQVINARLLFYYFAVAQDSTAGL